MCCVIGKNILATCIFLKNDWRLFFYFRFLFFKRSESAFWLRSSLLGAETMLTHLSIFIVWYHLEVTYFV